MTTAAISPDLPGIPEQPRLSEPQRLANVFFAPKKTFTDINRNAQWWAPFLLVAIFSMGFVYVMGQRVGWTTAFNNQMRMSPKQADKMEQMPPAQRAMAEKFFSVTAYGFWIFALIGMALIAAVLMATFNFGAGAEIKYSRALAVVVYANLPLILRSVIAIVVMYLPQFDPAGFILQNPAATNLGVLVDPGTHLALYTLLSSIDLFGIWILVLTAIGFACISKVKQSTSMIIVFGWWAVTVLARTGWAAIS